MIWTEGVSRFDVLTALRLLERKWKRIDSPIWVIAETNLGALGTCSPSFDTEEDMENDYTRHAGFDIRIEVASDRADQDEIEGSILHELVHVGQMERTGMGRTPSTGLWTETHANEDGDLGFDATVAYYGLFMVEYEAKQQEIALVLGRMNRSYWSALLKESEQCR